MIADKRYQYDKAGNPISIESVSNEFDNRYMTWDAENRLRRLDTQSESHIYTYNHAGERTLKRFASAENLSINGADRASLMSLSSEFTAYISPYFVATDNSYTKHYFSEGTRIASKIGTAVYNATPSVDSSVTNIVSNPIDMQAGSTYSSSGEEEKDLYFFHTDHLGSTTYLTGREEVEQYIAYTPYGEPFVETRSVSPYKFNGKELDTETGLYYYGARYYNPATALWLGVDPLASKYPGGSPYVYCVGNPVKYVDPDGRENIISFCIDNGDPHFESQESIDNRVLIRCAENYYDNENSVSVWAHGNNNGFVTAYDEEENTINSFHEFLSISSDVYIENQITQETTLIIMHSCSTGKENGFAQKMSEELNIVIVAPSENIEVDRKTANEIGVKNGGTWNIFYKGKKMDSFEGTTKPIFKNPEQMIETYKTKYKQLYEKE